MLVDRGGESETLSRFPDARSRGLRVSCYPGLERGLNFGYLLVEVFDDEQVQEGRRSRRDLAARYWEEGVVRYVLVEMLVVDEVHLEQQVYLKSKVVVVRDQPALDQQHVSVDDYVIFVRLSLDLKLEGSS